MAIKRNSCRISERKRMKDLHARGFSIPQISNAVSVHEHIVTQVLDGSWDALEKEGRVQQKKNDAARLEEVEKQKVADAAVVATAVVQALSQEQQDAADEKELRKTEPKAKAS